MADYCNTILENDIQSDCDNPVVKGIEADGVIINRSDIDFPEVVFDATRKNVIKTLTLKTGKRGYKVSVMGNDPFTGTTTTMEEGTNRNSFTNNLAFVILDNDPDVTKIIDSLAGGEFVVVYENKFKNLNKTTNAGDSIFQIVGYYQGLKASALENDKYSEDTEGGWAVTLTETKSPKSALFMYDTSSSATRTAFDELTNPPA